MQVATPNLCATSQAVIELTPVVQDTCLLLKYSGTAGTTSKTLAPTAPTLNVSKSGPDVVNAGESFVYTLTVSGVNRENITPTFRITDVLPSVMAISSLTPTAGTAISSNNTITWTLPTTGSGAYTETLLINTRIPTDTGSCGAGSCVDNTVEAFGTVCPQCPPLTDSAVLRTCIQDPLSPANTFTVTTSTIEPCSTAPQFITAAMHIGIPITWTGTIYTDTLGASTFGAPFNVVSNTVQVTVNGVNRTNDVTITLGPPLVINLSNVGTVSNTADITITYQVTAGVGTNAGTAFL